MAEVGEWYFEYHIQKDRFGLLGDIASVLGMLSINIVTLSGVQDRRRGFLLQSDDPARIETLKTMLTQVDNITVTALRKPRLIDRLALKHGRLIEREADDAPYKTYRFTRDDLGLLVDFVGEHLKRSGNQVMGIRGMPRVGKTESMVAASVYAGKRWTFISSTLLKQTLRTDLTEDELSTDDHVYIIDGIVSTMRGNEDHMRLVRRILRLPAPKIIEHPDLFVQRTEFTWGLFDRVIELRNAMDEEITYHALENPFME
ncbi:DUF3388 domain-containing protein [Sulfoacidibacillus thermotolerans]|uniref:DUF3388 domain-containing protein n=1 Tax=Sulfoacidibacillus thermotolerans TaxID=1765684 RepID=A0A2U3DAC4_SULT2|nr:DUF3388 domain-containing protein [Sulfoacidibacillus thermotolerans]PWI58238.1 hypothetical protein BM613_04740 [Sulfoacidibacillus thermotolerans]